MRPKEDVLSLYHKEATINRAIIRRCPLGGVELAVAGTVAAPFGEEDALGSELLDAIIL